MVLLFVVYCAHSQEVTDTLRLNEVEVATERAPRGVMHDGKGNITLTRGGLMQGMRAMGESDAVNALLMLPGFTSGSDYASGVSAGGHGYWQTSYSIDGTRVFYPFHFGGLFSTFNTPHYSVFRVKTNGDDFTQPMCIGAAFDARTPMAVTDSLSGTANVGVLASSASVAVPVTRRTSVYLSGRVSYVDMIGSVLADTETQTTRYAFSDANATIVHAFGDGDVLKINGFANFDKVRFTDRDFDMLTTLRWSNLLANASWRHSGARYIWDVRASYSQSDNNLGVDFTNRDIDIPSRIRQSTIGLDISDAEQSVKAGASIEYTDYRPQHLNGRESADLHSCLSEIHASKQWRIDEACSVLVGARPSVVHSGGRDYFDLNPLTMLFIDKDMHHITVSLAGRAQYIQEVGFADIGISSNFRIPPLAGVRPLRAYGVDVAYSNNSLIGNEIGVEARVFGKRIVNEAAYRGNLLDVLSDGYDPLRHIETSNGYNVGGDVNLRAGYGALSGWVGYSLAVCRRKYADSPDVWLPSSVEPLHSVKAYCEYSVNSRLKFIGNFIMASGRCYTPVSAIYIVGGNVLVEYGRRNSARLPMYHRLDFSAVYTFPAFKIGKRLTYSNLNFTMINAYGHRNVEMQNFAYDVAQKQIVLHQFDTLYRFLPSLSYTVWL